MANLYDTLGVAKSASADEIKKAYRKLAREHHPDAGRRRGALQGDPGRLRRALRSGEAEGVRHLGLDERPRRAGGLRGSRSSRTSTSATSSAGSSAAARSRWRGEARPAARARRRPPDRRSRSPSRTRWRARRCACRSNVETACHTCAGSGAEPGTAPTVCPQCNGRGSRPTRTGSSRSRSRARAAAATARSSSSRARRAAARAASGREALHVKIPAGAKNGTRIRLKGRGEAGRSGGPAGDLWVVARVAPSTSTSAAAPI